MPKLINPHGVEVCVPAEAVDTLLENGFKYPDKKPVAIKKAKKKKATKKKAKD